MKDIYGKEIRCAWCMMELERKHTVVAPHMVSGKCPECGCYNDEGQAIITMNSIKDTYNGSLKLIEEVVVMFEQILDIAGVDIDDVKDALDTEHLVVNLTTASIVKELFLNKGNSSGGTSTRNLLRKLGENRDYISWEIGGTQ